MDLVKVLGSDLVKDRDLDQVMVPDLDRARAQDWGQDWGLVMVQS